MTPLKTLRDDAVLLWTIVGGFCLLAAVITVGIVEHAIDFTAVALMLGSLVSGTVTVVGVLAVQNAKSARKEGDSK